MCRKVIVQILSIAIFLFICLPEYAKAITTARLVSVTERRCSFLLEKSESKDVVRSKFVDFSRDPMLILSIELQGEDVMQAIRFGKLGISTAKDDKGRILKQIVGGYNNPVDSFVKINRIMMFGMMFMRQSDIPKDRIRFDLHLELSSREAKKIELIKGSVKLKTGETTDVIIDSMKSKEGSAINNKILQGCGVAIKINPDPNGEEGAKSVSFEAQGNLNNILAINLLDATGFKLDIISRGSHGSDERRSYTLETDTVLGEDAKIALTMVTRQQTITIPFEFKDVPLP